MCRVSGQKPWQVCRKPVGHSGKHAGGGYMWGQDELTIGLPADDVCDSCGQPVPVGGWPYCKSERNPEGHTRGTYHFKMHMSMKTQGWTRRPR